MKKGMIAVSFVVALAIVWAAPCPAAFARQQSAADDLNKKADDLYKSGKFREAIVAYKEVLKVDANNDHAIGYIGYAFNKLGDGTSAREWMKRRVELQGQTPSRKAQTLTEMSLLFWDQAHLLLISHLAAARAVAGPAGDPATLVKSEGGVLAAKLLTEGIDSGQKAVAIAPRSAKAFNLLNLMYRDSAILETEAAKKADLIAKADAALRQSLQFFEALADKSGSDLFLTPTVSAANSSAGVKVGAARKNPTPEGSKDDAIAVEVIVGVDGKVKLPRVIAGQGKFGEAALASIKQWEFEPTTFEGHPVQLMQVITLPVK